MSKVRSTGKKADLKQAEKTTSYDQVLEVAANLKNAIESKNAKGIENLLSSSVIWLSNKPSDAKGFIDALDKLTEKSTDVEFSLIKLEKAEVEDNEVAIESDAQIIWTNNETWEEKEVSFKLFLGMTKYENDWQIKYLNITSSGKSSGQLTIETPLSGSYFDTSKFISQTPYFSDETLLSPYFSSFIAAPYFSSETKLGPVGFSDKPAKEEPKADIPSLVAIYMPVLVPSTFIKKLFDN
jgi:hypothetical protein